MGTDWSYIGRQAASITHGRGLWCPHGHHVLVPDPHDSLDPPRLMPADPWPCPGEDCSLQHANAELAMACGIYDNDLWEIFCELIYSTWRKPLWDE